jgi:hypothetical protein
MRAVIGVVMALVVTACSRAVPPSQFGNAGGPANPEPYGAEVRQAYLAVRAATAAFHNIDSATAQGYPATVAQCLSDSTHGGMGFHHVNRRYLSKELDVARPQILLYERDDNGKYVLNGVEFIVPYRLWPKDSIPPRIMGRNLVRSEPLQLWYMHMWVWKPNPAGLFADWNPRVRCRA